MLITHQSDQDSSNSSKSSELSEQNNINNNDNSNNINHFFWSKNVRFLDFNFKLNSVNVKKDKQLYYNIFSFTNWIWVMTFTMNTTILQQNLQSCLLDKTDHWYIKEFNYLSQLNLQNIKSVEKWCKTLKTKFQNSFSCIFMLLKNVHYTVQDVQWCHNSVNYV